MPKVYESGGKSPEDWLSSSPTEKQRGRLQIFLGYAPGVEKTFSMLSEGIRRRGCGEDVVVGIVETHGRAGTSELARKLEQITSSCVEYKVTLFSEMNGDAVFTRAPQIVLVDELAHVGGSSQRGVLRAARYE